jgi:iron complex transport system ATP-binding protein
VTATAEGSAVPEGPSIVERSAGPAARAAGPVALRLSGVEVWAVGERPGERVPILAGVDWEVLAGERWALLGPNGAGKTTLLGLAGAVRHPSAGAVEVLGERLGRTDMRRLRGRIGAVDAATARAFPVWLTAEDVVLTGATGTIQPLWERYGGAERQRARELLESLRCGPLRTRPFASCSDGERQRIRLARALLAGPDLLLLDEPASGLDLPAREALLAALARLERLRPELATVTVTHHVEEVAASTTHALLLRAGRVVAAGPAAEVLTGEHLSVCFGLDVEVRRVGDRWAAWAPARWT